MSRAQPSISQILDASLALCLKRGLISARCHSVWFDSISKHMPPILHSPDDQHQAHFPMLHNAQLYVDNSSRVTESYNGTQKKAQV